MNQPRPYIRALGVAIYCMVAATIAHSQSKYALLVGIDTYWGTEQQIWKLSPPHPGKVFGESGENRWNMSTWPNLVGAVSDVRSVQSLLTSPKFGFPSDANHVHVLNNAQATRTAILDAMERYLVDQPVKGDTAVFYYAGHGSQRRNSKTDKTDKLDETIVPSDANTGQFDIRDKEIARILNAALDKGVHVTAIFDSCHSGTIARGIPLASAGAVRFLGYDPRDAADPPDRRPDGTLVPRPEDRSDNAALVFTSTQHDQVARERKFDDGDHGVFTMALLEALNALPANSSARDIYKRVRVLMQSMELDDQQPVLGGTESRQDKPMFGVTSGSSHYTVAIGQEGVLRDGRVVIDAGVVSGIGPGSELVKVGDGTNTESIRLRVVELFELNKAMADVLTANASIHAGDLFELRKWVPALQAPLQVWMPPGALAPQMLEEFASELAAVRKSTMLTFVDDPVAMPPTHMLEWDGSAWKLTAAKGKSKILGDRPNFAQIFSSFDSGSHLFVNFPPSKKLATDLLRGGVGNTALQIVSSPTLAKYLLVGRFRDSGFEYSWVRRDVIEQARVAPGASAPLEPVCSTDSPYPRRTDWISARTPLVDQVLVQYANRLARVHAWLHLPQLPAGGEAIFPYKLALKRRDMLKDVYVNSGKVFQGELYDLVLRSDHPVPTTTSRQWVYVVGIDCTGRGKLLYPLATTPEGNLKPERGRFDQEISLTGSGQPVSILPPFGVDTYILLTTSDQLPDPSALSFDGALTWDSSDFKTPSETLENTGDGFRGLSRPLRTEWTTQILEIESVPKER